MCMHAQVLQPIISVTKFGLNSLQATHYPMNAASHCREREEAAAVQDQPRTESPEDIKRLYHEKSYARHRRVSREILTGAINAAIRVAQPQSDHQ